MKRVLFDTDVIVDALTTRQPFHTDSARALATASTVQGYVAGHAVPTLFYILRRQIGSSPARTALIDLLKTLHVAPVTDSVIREALAGPFSDFEDGVTHAAALAERVDVIVTRNAADFKSATVTVASPDEYCQSIAPPKPTQPPTP